MTRFQFDDFLLDADRFELRRAGDLVAVEPKVLDLLSYLVANAGRVVPKNELIDHVWGDAYVSESALTTRLAAARQAVGDDGRAQRIIRTVHRRGYEFVSAVRTDERRGEPMVEAKRIAGTAWGTPMRPPAKPLIGRADLVDDLSRRLSPGRLVTVVGPAGVGKTHLVHHVAGLNAADFDDGSYFVPLASIRDGEAVAQAVLDALDRPQQPGATVLESVAAAMADMRALVVLDNCEHVRSSVAALLRPIVATMAEVAIVTTSRQRLGLAGEQLVALDVLDPDASATLFTARAADHGVRLDPESRLVTEVCRMLDHLPLALELAGARVRVLGLEALAGLLDDRLRLLEEPSGVDPHHRTLELAIGSSFDELEPSLQQTLCHFSQFAGSFDLAAALALARAGRELDEVDAIRHVIELSEGSLIVVEEGAETRYRLLESIRLFAAERLQDSSEVRAAHVRHFRTAAEDRDARSATPEFEQAWTELGADWSNYRAAVSYGIELGLFDDTFALLRSTIGYAELAQRFEHEEWTNRALAAASADEPGTAVARAALVRLLFFRGRQDDVVDLAAMTGDPHDEFAVALAHFWASWGQGHHDRAEELAGLLDGQVRGTGGISELYVQSLRQMLATFGDAELGDADERTLRITQSGGPVGRVFRLNMEVRRALRAGEPRRALDGCQEMVAAARACGMQTYQSAALLNRAIALQSLDSDEVRAKEILAGLEHQSSVGYWTAIRPEAGVAADLLLAAGRPEEAAQILGGCERHSYRGHGSELIDELTVAAEQVLGEAFQPAFDRGLRMTPAELTEYAIEQLTRLVDR